MNKISQIEDYITYQKSCGKSSLTLTSYRSDLVQFAKWFERINSMDLKLLKITPTDMRYYKQHLMDANLRPQTINRRLLSVKYFLEWGWATKRIKSRFPLPQTVKHTQSTPKWLSKTQQNKLLRHVERYGTIRDKAIIKALLNTGLRVSELCSIKWTHVTLTDRKGKVQLQAGKGEKYRDIPLNQEARQAFLDLEYPIYAGTNEFVFKGQRGPLSPRGIQLMLKRLNLPKDLGDVSPHSFRHTFCKNLVNAGVSLEKVAALAGHERLETTKLYCHPSFADLTEAVERIGELETCAS